jgi:hypothetical protein
VRLGYRDAREYSTRHGGISLATATAISSAPAAAQEFAMGGLAFFRNLLNALEPQRGWWLGNPGWGGGRSFQRSNPPSLLGPMIHEAFNDINEGSQWLPLTNAGRFDNLGLFEMVLRRCHIIVVSDATRDPDHLFAELGTAIWRTRVELGVPIELQKLNMLPRKSKKQGAYCAVGRIVYSAVDGHGAVDGLLVYLKPVLYDEPALPTDLYSYGAKAPDFPHESIRRGAMADQQFEMYRALGRHCIEQIVTTRKEIGGQKPPAVAGMLEQLPTDWRLESPGEFASLAERHAKRRGRPKAPPHQWHSRRA